MPHDARRGVGRRRWLHAALLAVPLRLARPQQLDPATPSDAESLSVKVLFDGEERSLGVSLDANYRWLYDSTSTTCDSTTPSAMEACYLQGVEPIDYEGTYGVFAGGADPSKLTLKYASLGRYASAPNYGVRVLLTQGREGSGYTLFELLGTELSFEIDLSKVPAGMNAAVYFVSMDAGGGLGERYADGQANAAGWKRGVGYCDAQCPTDVSFVQDVGWRPRGTVMSCCPEMDVFEGNRFAAAMTAHPCRTYQRTACNTKEEEECANPCDTDGADINMFRRYGPSNALFELLDPAKPITVRTQFNVDDAGVLSEIGQTFEQVAPDGSMRSFTQNLTDASVAEQKRLFGVPDTFAAVGGLAQMGAALDRGMVLVLAIWAEANGNMNWLDSCKANETLYSCEENGLFKSADVFSDAWAKAPGAWRGPVDHFNDSVPRFAAKAVTLSYPGIPEWMRQQAMFQCPEVGGKYDCSGNDFQFSVRGISVRSLGEPVNGGGVPWYAWLVMAVGAALLVMGVLALVMVLQRRRMASRRQLCGSDSEGASTHSWSE